MAGDRIVAGGRVILHGVSQRANDGHLVHPLGHFRQQLANLHARHVGRDGLVRTADRVGRVRLHIESIDLAGPAPLEQKDHGLSTRLDPWRGVVPGGVQQFGKGQPQQPRAADTQNLPAIGKRRVNSRRFQVHRALLQVSPDAMGSSLPVKDVERNQSLTQPDSPLGQSPFRLTMPFSSLTRS